MNLALNNLQGLSAMKLNQTKPKQPNQTLFAKQNKKKKMNMSTGKKSYIIVVILFK